MDHHIDYMYGVGGLQIQGGAVSLPERATRIAGAQLVDTCFVDGYCLCGPRIIIYSHYIILQYACIEL